MSLVIIVSLVFVILSVNGQTTQTPKEDCGPNATWYTCSRRCPYTCSMLNGIHRPFCPGDCIEGCMCNPGYIRQSRTNLCVLPRDCNRTISS